MANTVAIVGRPNVGKSTLFNRLVEQRQAIMHDEPGVTRDRHYGYAEWTNKRFTVIDTGGYVQGSEDVFESKIRSQVEIAIEEASVILFMVDSSVGLTDFDKEFANVLRQTNKPVLVVANKADNQERMLTANEFYELGFDSMFPVSSVSGSGTGELLDAVVANLSDEGKMGGSSDIPKIAILGRPNVGKSSFVNTILGEERTIVTDIAGTTRDSINTHYTRFGQDFILIDTAGIRRKTKVQENIEFYSVMRAIKALQDCDVCIILIDAVSGLESQDMNIIHLAHKYRKGIMLMVNKWDLISKDHKTSQNLKNSIEEKLGTLSYIPVIFTSVLKKQRILKAVEMATEIQQNRTKKVPTSKLNDVILPLIEKNPPPAVKGKHIKIKYLTQLPTKTPAIAFFCNLPQYIKPPYQRYLENQLRKNFNFSGVPLAIFFRKK